MKKNKLKGVNAVPTMFLRDHPLMRLIDALNETGEEYLVAIASNSGMSSFGPDNWSFFKDFATREIITFGKNLFCSLGIQRFEKVRDSGSGLPFKSVCGVVINGNDIFPASAEDTELASFYEQDTGKPIEEDNLMIFVEFHDMLPNFKKS